MVSKRHKSYKGAKLVKLQNLLYDKCHLLL